MPVTQHRSEKIPYRRKFAKYVPRFVPKVAGIHQPPPAIGVVGGGLAIRYKLGKKFMTRITSKPRKLRSQLLLSASLLTVGLVSYGRPAHADCDIVVGEANTHLCSGDVPNSVRLSNYGGDRAITVVADEDANFTGGFKYNLTVRAADISIEIREGAQFNRGLRVDSGMGYSTTGTTGIDIIFNGDIDHGLPSTPGFYADVSAGKYGHGIDVRGKYGDTRVITGSGDITLREPINKRDRYFENSGIEVDASFRNSGNVVVETGAGTISGGTNGVNIDAARDVTVTTGAGSVTGTEHGILVDQGGYNGMIVSPRRDVLGEPGTVQITTGSGDISGEKYGIGAFAENANIQITTGSGTIGLAGDVENGSDTFAGISAIANKYNGNPNAGNVEVTIGEGTVNGSFGVLAFGANTSVTVSGDVVANGIGAGILVSSGNKYAYRPDALVEAPIEQTGLNIINIRSGGSVNAENATVGIASKYGNSEITIAGEVIGGQVAAIQTNINANYGGGAIYAGTTRVELQSGFAITGDVIAGGERDDDVLALGGSGDLSFDLSTIDNVQLALNETVRVLETEKQFFNFDEFEKIGNGTATINGFNAQIDNFAVREGTLQMSDVLADAMAVDLEGGQLTGTGRIGNLVARDATTVSPGVGNGISTIEVANSVTFENGSTFAVDLNAQGESDLLDVDGSATIGTDVNLAITGEAGDYSAEDLEWTVISTAGGVSGSFETVTDSLVDVDFEDIYDGETVVLQAIVAVTPLVDPPITPPVDAPITLPVDLPITASGVSDKSNGPAGAAGAGVAGLSFASNLNKVPQKQNSGGSNQTTSTSDLTVFGKENFSSKGGMNWGMTDMTVFFGTFTEQTEVETSDTNLGYDTKSTGFLGGLSYNDDLGDNSAYQLNLGLGYSSTHTGTEEGYADSTSFHFGVGGALTSGPLNLLGALGYSSSAIDLARQVGSATATAQTDARTFSGVIQASYDVAAKAGLPEGARLAPMVRIRGYATTADAYSESGAGILNLNVNEMTSDAVYAGVGIEYSGSYEFNGSTLRPSLNMIYDTKISGDHTNAISTITGVSGAFDTSVNTGPDHVFSIDAGVAFDIEDNVEGFVNYGTTFGDDLQSHRGTVGLTIKF